MKVWFTERNRHGPAINDKDSVCRTSENGDQHLEDYYGQNKITIKTINKTNVGLQKGIVCPS